MARPAASAISAFGILLALAVLGILGYAYAIGPDRSPLDYFGYFTNLTSLLTAAILASAGAYGLLRRTASPWLVRARAVAVPCMIVVGVVYNVLVPGTGAAPPWVSIALHAVLPLVVLLDWAVAGDRGPLPWRGLWIVLLYPLLWIAVVLLRGRTDGWVPYGFLLPERGLVSLLLHIAGLLLTLLAAGALAWALSRTAGLSRSTGRSPARRRC